MNPAARATAGETFRRLHEGPDVLVLPNPWDAGTAKIFASLGFSALATTSAGLAFTLGRRDGGTLTADETFAHVREIVEATPLPVSADLENGFGGPPEIVAATIRRAGEVGLAGASIEDATYDAADPLYEHSLAVERIHAAAEAARALRSPFTLTARAENFIQGRPDLEDVIRRLSAYERAGADVLFAPGLPDERSIRAVCRSLARPVSYLVGAGGPRVTLASLAEMGVRRVTTGASLARVAIAAARDAAGEMRDRGTFDFAEGTPGMSHFTEAWG